jgi:hypothetical protein
MGTIGDALERGPERHQGDPPERGRHRFPPSHEGPGHGADEAGEHDSSHEAAPAAQVTDGFEA